MHAHEHIIETLTAKHRLVYIILYYCRVLFVYIINASGTSKYYHLTIILKRLLTANIHRKHVYALFNVVLNTYIIMYYS